MRRQDLRRFALWVLVAGSLSSATWALTYAHTRNLSQSGWDALIVLVAGIVCCAVCDDESEL